MADETEKEPHHIAARLKNVAKRLKTPGSYNVTRKAENVKYLRNYVGKHKSDTRPRVLKWRGNANRLLSILSPSAAPLLAAPAAPAAPAAAAAAAAAAASLAGNEANEANEAEDASSSVPLNAVVAEDRNEWRGGGVKMYNTRATPRTHERQPRHPRRGFLGPSRIG
jgi:ribosomal protein L12E/L44/L45/RPP1/RPP2